MENVTRVAMDLAKHVFHVTTLDGAGAAAEGPANSPSPFEQPPQMSQPYQLHACNWAHGPDRAAPCTRATADPSSAKPSSESGPRITACSKPAAATRAVFSPRAADPTERRLPHRSAAQSRPADPSAPERGTHDASLQRARRLQHAPRSRSAQRDACRRTVRTRSRPLSASAGTPMRAGAGAYPGLRRCDSPPPAIQAVGPQRRQLVDAPVQDVEVV